MQTSLRMLILCFRLSYSENLRSCDTEAFYKCTSRFHRRTCKCTSPFKANVIYFSVVL